MNLPVKSLSEPFNRFGSDSIKAITYRDADHVPYHMRRFEAREKKAHAELEIIRYDNGSGSASIQMTEMTTNKNGHVVQKVISLTLSKEHRLALAAFLAG